MLDEYLHNLFNEDGLSPEDAIRLKRQKEFGLPLMMKGKEMIDLVKAITAAIRPDDYDPQKGYTEEEILADDEAEMERLMGGESEPPLLSDSHREMLLSQLEVLVMTINVKLAGAIRTPSYILQMENAVLAKVNARELNTLISLLKYEGVGDKEHWQLLRIAIEDFRLLFRQWIKTISPDKLSEEGDGWNLFIDDKDSHHDQNNELNRSLDNNEEEKDIWNDFFGGFSFDDDDDDDDDDDR